MLDPDLYDYRRIGPGKIEELRELVAKGVTNWALESLPEDAKGEPVLPSAYGGLKDRLVRDENGRLVHSDAFLLRGEVVPSDLTPPKFEKAPTFTPPKPFDATGNDASDSPRRSLRQHDIVSPYTMHREERRISEQALRQGVGTPETGRGFPERGFGGARPDESPVADQPERLDGASLETPLREASLRPVSPIAQARLPKLGRGAKLAMGATSSEKPVVAAAVSKPAVAYEPGVPNPAAVAAVGPALDDVVARYGRKRGPVAENAVARLINGDDPLAARNAAMGVYAQGLADREKGDDDEALTAIAALPEAVETTAQTAELMGRARKSGKTFYGSSEGCRQKLYGAKLNGAARRTSREGRFTAFA